MSDDFDFASLMASQGVQRMGKGGSSSPRPPHGGADPASMPVVRSAVVRASELDAVVHERDAARTRVTELTRLLQSRDATIEARREQAAQAAEAREEELAAQAEAAEKHAAALSTAQGQVAELRSALREARSTLDASNAAKTSLADALLERGCADEYEMLAVLNGLLLQRPREFLDSLVLADPHALAQVLSDRVAFVSKGVEFTPDKNTVVVSVCKARCEICGGSDIAASFHGFAQACIDKDIHVVTVVGGSPAYRKQLTALASADKNAPRLNLVSGTRRREARKAQSDMRSSDVVVIWGGGELDHSVADVYRGGDVRIIRIAHRGIARMLQLVRSQLRSG